MNKEVESEVFSDYDDDFDLTPHSTDDDTQLERIVMVSPPESPKDDVVFQPPPEGSIADDSSQEKEPAPDRGIEGGDGYEYVYMDETEVSSVNPNNENFKALLDFLQMCAGEMCAGDDDGDSDSEEEVDLLETVRQRGMIFPRPRW
ncbi:uncharacterized protein LOC124926766 isoform X2 [Impatiens glandulifera]|uniref:uncharacterized protein LOC124926766 isoform X1 n=1 Tax=Impatiens glandulifera TaxID=253017 RepID=UPI001FB07A81|nr:uncharacterized protein LOC124926766 isoform X1 [Impatiens glandulifera]XP_047323013.1 uncharacterized protein LOC124926766 isoform X2 [Impatiens glandulifera]